MKKRAQKILYPFLGGVLFLPIIVFFILSLPVRADNKLCLQERNQPVKSLELIKESRNNPHPTKSIKIATAYKPREKRCRATSVVHEFGNYFRKLIKINPDGSYVIQDFYSADNKPYSNQYVIQKKEDLKKETDEQTSINGQYVYFDSYGRTLTINYKNGKKEGLSVKALKEGKKVEEMVYRDNLLNGKYVSWWRNGNKKAEANFVNGKEEGANALWHKNGQKSFVGSMKDGKMEGKFLAWHENGQKKIDGNAVAGKEHGKLVSWYENGQKSSELFLEHGEIRKCSQFDEHGKVIYSEETSSEICRKVYQKFYTMTLESEESL